jgi:hypothetical protein
MESRFLVACNQKSSYNSLKKSETLTWPTTWDFLNVPEQSGNNDEYLYSKFMENELNIFYESKCNYSPGLHASIFLGIRATIILFVGLRIIFLNMRCRR